MKLEDGADDRNRTGDLRVTSALLYQLSYIGVPARIISGEPSSRQRLTIMAHAAMKNEHLRHDRFPHPRSPSPIGRGVQSDATRDFNHRQR